jgi:putative FmdB family regulatory protein
MPTYDYQCTEGHRFEVFQKMTDDPEATCPECGSPAERVISGGAGFLFKGEGFYITDYRSEEYKKKASAEGPQKSETTSPSADTSSSSKESSSSESGGSSTSSDA